MTRRAAVVTGIRIADPEGTGPYIAPPTCLLIIHSNHSAHSTVWSMSTPSKLEANITRGAYGITSGVASFIRHKWQGIVQYWRAYTTSACSEATVGRGGCRSMYWDQYTILFRVARDYLNILGRRSRTPLPTRWSTPALAIKMKWSRILARAVSSFRTSIIVLRHSCNHVPAFLISCRRCRLDQSTH